jgi:hypothetical protein
MFCAAPNSVILGRAERDPRTQGTLLYGTSRNP